MNECKDVRSADQKNKLTEADIESRIVKEEYYTLGKKTTACVLTLVNGFEVTGISACVDPANYSQEVGAPFAKKKAVDLIWAAEAYLLQESLFILDTLKESMDETREVHNEYVKSVVPEAPKAEETVYGEAVAE